MTVAEAEDEYLKAVRLGQKECAVLQGKGQNPFPVVLDLGGGQFALCLIPGAKAKTGTVTLNLFCEGNTTAKPSGTVSVKVEIR